MKTLFLISIPFILAGCNGSGQGPTAAQCHTAALAGHASCDIAFTKPEDLSKCHGGVAVAETLCLLNTTPEPEPARPPTSSLSIMRTTLPQTRQERATAAFPRLLANEITGEQFKAFVLDNVPLPR